MEKETCRNSVFVRYSSSACIYIYIYIYPAFIEQTSPSHCSLLGSISSHWLYWTNFNLTP